MEKKASTESEHRHKERDKSVHRLRYCRLCDVPHVDAGLGDKMTHWGVTGTHKHNSSWGPSCCSVLLASGGGRQILGRQGPRRALVNRGLWLVTHPGKPKALW